MKKLNVLILMLMIAGFAFSQSYVITNADTSMWGAVGTSLQGVATIKNTSGTMKIVNCRRTMLLMQTGNTNSFCWGVSCYGSLTNYSPNADTIAAGDSTLTFSGHLVDSMLPGVNIVMYTFYTKGDTTDSVSFIAKYYFGAAGINQLSAEPNLFAAYPNPAENNTTIHYSIANNVHSSKLILTDIIGNKLNEYPLDPRNNTYLLPTYNLNNGIYFYSLEADGQMITTKKLIVSH